VSGAEKGLSEIQKLARGCQKKTRSWFQGQGEAHQKEQSVIHTKTDVAGWVRLTKAALHANATTVNSFKPQTVNAPKIVTAHWEPDVECTSGTW